MQRGQSRYTLAIDAQLDLLRYYSSGVAKIVLGTGPNMLGRKGQERDERWANQLSLGVTQQLTYATPIYVAPHIVNMLEDAMGSFPGQITVTEEDFPARVGFVYLDGAWSLGLNPSGSEDYMRAFGWSLAEGDVHLAIYGPNRIPGRPDPHDDQNQLNQIDIWQCGQPYDRDIAMEALVDGPDQMIEWKYFAQDGMHVKQVSQHEAVVMRYLQQVQHRRFVYAVLSFMRQKIAARAPRNLPRAHRRSLPKEYRGEEVVQVITLRGYEEVAHPYEQAEAQGVEWASRWVVRGHWRNQWYPGEGTHKPKWIDAYVKGPDGLPVKNATKLIAVTR